MEQKVSEDRIRSLNSEPLRSGPVVYWMSRDQRVKDNWALLYARELALELETPLIVVFCLVPKFLGATMRHYSFMLEGLAEVESLLAKLQVGFYLLEGDPASKICAFCREMQAGALVCDFSPLRIKREWKAGVTENLSNAFFEVDAHNIVPYWVASPKQEYAAYTFRPKIKKLLPEFLTAIPQMGKHPYQPSEISPSVDWQKTAAGLKIEGEVKDVPGFRSGEKAAWEMMRFFLENKIAAYETDRNDPTREGQSNLSPYLHFGQLSAQRLALLAKVADAPGVHSESFLEELIVRRELSDNFCYYNDRYDSVEAFPRWAKETLTQHADDPREYIYTLEELEKAVTHDRLWNAAQSEMVVKGKMHGYMRMYWAKKILEWTESPQQAMEIAIYLNDKYSLDGRDPNGYTGIAWSIGGVHDRAWFERPIFGKIRFMSYKGSKSKFAVEKYTENNPITF